MRLGDQHADTAGGLDLLLGAAAEEARLDDQRLLRQAALAQHLAKSLH